MWRGRDAINQSIRPFTRATCPRPLNGHKFAYMQMRFRLGPNLFRPSLMTSKLRCYSISLIKKKMKKLSCWGTIDVMRIFILNWCERDAALSIPNSIFKSVEAVTRIFDVSHLLRWKSKWEHVKWIQKEVIHQNVGLIVRWTTDIKERFGWMTVMLGEANALIIQCCCERSRAESCKLILWWWNSGGSWLCRTEQRFKDLYWFVYSFDWHVIIMEIKHRLFDQTQRETRAIVGNWLLNTTDKQKKERERERGQERAT